MQLVDRDACVTDLGFDRWFAHEHSVEREALLTEHLQSCARCRVRGELLEREREAFLVRAPSIAANAERVRLMRQAKHGWLRESRAPWLAVAAAAAVILASSVVREFVRRDAGPSTAGGAAHAVQADGERRKGGFDVGFYVKRGSSIERGASGETVYPGDQLRFTYTSAAPSYLALLGRDAHSSSVYFPVSGDATRVAAGNDAPLDFSLELDAQLGTELLFALSCPAPYALAPLQQALLARGELPVPSGCQLERIELHKEAPP